MNKKLLFFIVLFSIVKGHAQSYMGYIPDNYAGVQGVLFNPASIADSRFKTDINLFSFSTSVSNDYYATSLFDLPKDSYDVEKDGIKSPSMNNSGILFMDVMGPSFMFNIAPKHSVAIFTRSRAALNIREINGELFDKLEGGFDDAADFDVNVGNPKIDGHAWGEVGASYAAVLWQNKQHFLKGGLTAKYLMGGIASYVDGTDITTVFDQNNVDPLASTLTTTGRLTIGSSQDVITGDEEFKFDTNSKGFGADLGLIYEWRPDYESYDLSKAKAVDNNFKNLNKYKLRFGVSVTDIGSIKYKNLKRDVYDINGSVTRQEIEDFDNLDQFLEDNYIPVETTFSDQKISLPTMLHLDVDWNIYRKFYLNANGNLGLTGKPAVDKTYLQDNWMITPRYETKWFTFSVPVNYMEYSGTQVGAALRVGPLFVGSSSIITNAISKESKAADIYLGLKIPVYQKKFKDRDGDDVIDKKDACPKVAGPLENKGCPWPDADGDTVVDKDDKCPNVAGPVENQGCPWGDADNDTLLDNVDACPSVAGPVENNGCPWPDTDGDSVLDKDDKCPNEIGLAINAGCPDTDKDGVIDLEDDCPTVVGPKSNKGCPEVTIEVIEKLKIQARSVFFNSGKSTFKTGDAATIASLEAMKEILKDYPNAKFTIEGHTDSDGSDVLNQKLSEDRANAVRNFLIEKGIKAENLTAIGYGESKPIASNKTKAGKALNRRTEVKHVGSTGE